MKRLIKLYSRLLDEMLYLEWILIISQLNIHYLFNLILQHIYPEYSDLYKNQQNENFRWFFFASQSIKKQYLK